MLHHTVMTTGFTHLVVLDDGARELKALEVQHQHFRQRVQVHVLCSQTRHVAALGLEVCEWEQVCASQNECRKGRNCKKLVFRYMFLVARPAMLLPSGLKSVSGSRCALKHVSAHKSELACWPEC